jgi:hypothetical protein
MWIAYSTRQFCLLDGGIGPHHRRLSKEHDTASAHMQSGSL